MQVHQTDNFYIGWASVDITPAGPVSLYGQYYERISSYVQSPLTVTACAMHLIMEGKREEQAIMVSLDIIHIPASLQLAVKEQIAVRIPAIQASKIFLNATHTHSGPDPDSTSDYGQLLISKVVECIEKAWSCKEPAGVSAKMGYAIVGHNRRALFADGSAEMYGDCTREDFIGIEGPSDPSVDMLFCWDKGKAIKGIIVNVACPAQVTEAKYFVSADYWGELRVQLKRKWGKDVFVLAQCSAAGDIAPRDLPANYKADEPNMWDINGMVELGSRLTALVDGALQSAADNIEWLPVFRHTVKQITIPPRKVNLTEYKRAKAKVEEIRSREPEDPQSPDTAWNRFLRDISENEKSKAYGPWDSKTSDFGWLKPLEIVMQQFEDGAEIKHYQLEMHIIRLGDIAFASNPFELFVDFGFAITARCKARQCFLVQFACDYVGYMATQRALDAGGYSAMANPYGADAGWSLVNETVKEINKLWD
jgi:hypothetical protein